MPDAKSGYYNIYNEGGEKKVYCDMVNYGMIGHLYIAVICNYLSVVWHANGLILISVDRIASFLFLLKISTAITAIIIH